MCELEYSPLFFPTRNTVFYAQKKSFLIGMMEGSNISIILSFPSLNTGVNNDIFKYLNNMIDISSKTGTCEYADACISDLKNTFYNIDAIPDHVQYETFRVWLKDSKRFNLARGGKFLIKKSFYNASNEQYSLLCGECHENDAQIIKNIFNIQSLEDTFSHTIGWFDCCRIYKMDTEKSCFAYIDVMKLRHGNFSNDYSMHIFAASGRMVNDACTISEYSNMFQNGAIAKTLYEQNIALCNFLATSFYSNFYNEMTEENYNTSLLANEKEMQYLQNIFDDLDWSFHCHDTNYESDADDS